MRKQRSHGFEPQRETMKHNGIFIPTPQGPIGGVVTVPETDPAACAILLHGGRGARGGPHFVRLSDTLAELGFVVLRMDYPGEGDSSLVAGGSETDAREAVIQAGEWFQRRNADLDLLVYGRCYGARSAIALAAKAPTIIGLGLTRPFLREVSSNGGVAMPEEIRTMRRARRLGLERPPVIIEASVDPALRADFDVVVGKAPVWALVGEDDDIENADLFRLRDDLGAMGERLEIETVTNLSLRGSKTLEAQAVHNERVIEWARRSIRQRVTS